MSAPPQQLVCALVLLKSSFRLAAANVHSHQPPEWKLCVEVAVPAAIDPLTVIQPLLTALGGVSAILVHQVKARSLLLHCYAQDVVVMVSQPTSHSRALWSSTAISASWSALLAVHWQWQPADMIHAHARRAEQTATKDGEPRSGLALGLFDKYRYRPAERETKTQM